jgi:hypothetical protein
MIGKILRALLARVVEDPTQNQRDTLLARGLEIEREQQSGDSANDTQES